MQRLAQCSKALTKLTEYSITMPDSENAARHAVQDWNCEFEAGRQEGRAKLFRGERANYEEKYGALQQIISPRAATHNHTFEEPFADFTE